MNRCLSVFIKFGFELLQGILKRGAQQLFMNGGDVVCFGLKQAVDNVVNHFGVKTFLNSYIFCRVDIFGREFIDIIELDPRVFSEKSFAAGIKNRLRSLIHPGFSDLLFFCEVVFTKR